LLDLQERNAVTCFAIICIKNKRVIH